MDIYQLLLAIDNADTEISTAYEYDINSTAIQLLSHRIADNKHFTFKKVFCLVFFAYICRSL